jgi:Uma2 family endonuclease
MSAMKILSKLFTYDDYLALPDDDKRYEIVEGELRMTPAPTTRHQDIFATLFTSMRLHAEQHALGKVLSAPIDLVLSLVDLVQPDILFVAKSRLHIITQKNIVAIPDLIVEIVSASSPKRDREEKRELYAKYKLPEFWIVDPESETVEVYRCESSTLDMLTVLTVTDQLKARQMEGYTIQVRDIFK